MDKPQVRLGKTIRDRRNAEGLTMHDLCDQAGISYGALQAIESGRSFPRTDTLEAICKVLGLTPSDIWGEPNPASRLSAGATNGLTAADVAVVVERIVGISPAHRGLVLAILFEDPSLAPDGLGDAIQRVLARGPSEPKSKSK